MYCSNCKKEISDSSKFCKYCGNQIIDIDIQNQHEKSNKQSKIIIHGYTGAYINIPVKVYEDDRQIGKINKGETFEYEISETKTLTLKCHIRSTEITVIPNKVTEIQLKFDNSGQLIYTYNDSYEKYDNDNISNVTNSKYRIHRYYGFIVLGIFITILIFHPKIIMDFPAYTLGDFLLDIIRHFDTFLLEIFGCVILLGAIVFSTAELLFKCPNCKEDIKLIRNKLEDVNDTTQTCKCPKCNKDLIFNTKENIVTVNTTTDKKEQYTNISTSKLEELYNLKTKGIITEEEFETKKKEFLDKM